MAADKALVEVHGRSMLDHALHLASEYEPAETIILGRPEHPLGIKDKEPFPGPARAISAYLQTIVQKCHILVLPVDMPLLRKTHTDALLNCPTGAYFEDQYLPFAAAVEPGLEFTGARMKELLSDLRINEIAVPEGWRAHLTNVNTPSTLKALNAT